MRLGVVGIGTIAREVLPLLGEWGIETVALCGTPRRKEELEKLCEEYHIGAVYTDYAAMLREADIDTVYIAVPNHLHYEFVKSALESEKDVIVEKPMVSNVQEAEALARLAKERNRYLFEAISTVYLPNYTRIRELLPRIGDIKLVQCNYSQYSRRYDAFRAGETLPAFDPEKSGGALMDLNLYNLHYILGLFGNPADVSYHANIEKGIDTSGILMLDYDSFKAVSIAAKDCTAPLLYTIQGTKGCIRQETPANFCGKVTLRMNDGTEEIYDENPSSRLESEFRNFAQEIASGDRTGCYRMLDHSVLVSRIQTKARLGAGIHFPADDRKF